MFGFVADIINSAVSVLLPVFFSYKALRTSDPAVLTPWLMYWTTLSLIAAVENQLDFILRWVPFYPWLRLAGHVYLVLPGQQGSMRLYQQYIHPFLEDHERQIDHFIADAHRQAKAAGMDAVKRAIEYVRVNFLGQPPRPPTPPPSRNVSYTTQLFNRFAMPTARDGLAAVGTGDLLGLLGKALQQTPTSGTRAAPADELIPSNLPPSERAEFITTQRERLRTLLSAFDSEPLYANDTAASSGTSLASRVASTPHPLHSRKSFLAPDDGSMHRSRSESEFEDLAFEPMPDPEQFRPHDYVASAGKAAGKTQPPREGAGWNNWVWGSNGEREARKEL